ESKARGCKHMGIIPGGCDRLPRDADSLVDLWTGDRDPMARSLQGPAATDQRHGWGIGRIEFERALQQPNRLDQAVSGPLVFLRQRAQVKVVGLEALGRLPAGAVYFGEAQPRFDRTDDARRHPVLQIEDVVERAVEAVGPDMGAGR